MPFKSKSQQRYMFALHPKMAREWAHETKDFKKLPEKVKPKTKKASIPLLAQITIAMNAFELSKEGSEKVGMNSMTLGSFFDELEKIGNALTGAAGAAIKFKPGITQAIPKLKIRPPSGSMVGQAASAGVGTVAGRAPRAAAAAGGGTMAGVVPKSLGGTTARPPSGSLTGTHVRPGTQISPRSPGQGSTRVNSPKPAMQTGSATTPRPAAPAAPASTTPAASRRKGLMGTLALGGAALGAGAMAGHMMPQRQQQQQAY